MSLLSQPVDRDYVVVWSGRDYLNAKLATEAREFPTREPSREEAACMNNARHFVPKTATSKALARECRVARGLCRDCPNPIGPGEIKGNTRCPTCSAKNSRAASISYFAVKKQQRQARKANGGIRCTRCKRRRREYSQWCRLCYDRTA